MNRKVELYRNCFKVLDELGKCRQKPIIDIDKEVEKRLLLDGSIKKNGLDIQITPKGDNHVQNKYYLELAERIENEEKEKELRERDSFINQRLVEETIKQTKIGWDNRKTMILSLVISSISLIVSILSFFHSCNR
jgi:hypothetical protein